MLLHWEEFWEAAAAKGRHFLNPRTAPGAELLVGGEDEVSGRFLRSKGSRETIWTTPPEYKLCSNAWMITKFYKHIGGAEGTRLQRRNKIWRWSPDKLTAYLEQKVKQESFAGRESTWPRLGWTQKWDAVVSVGPWTRSGRGKDPGPCRPWLHSAS